MDALPDLTKNPFTPEQFTPKPAGDETAGFDLTEINKHAYTPLQGSGQTRDEMFAAMNPAKTYGNPAWQASHQRRGFWASAIQGLPGDSGIYNPQYDPNYQPDFWEGVGSTLGAPVRDLAEVGAELLPDVQNARNAIRSLRETLPEMADKIETEMMGKELSGTETALKTVGALADLGLTLMPFTAEGKALLTAGKAYSLLGKTTIRASVGVNYGGLYGLMYGLHDSPGDYKKIAESTLSGVALGGGAELLGPVLGAAGKVIKGGVKVAKEIPGVQVGMDFVRDATHSLNESMAKNLSVEGYTVATGLASIKRATKGMIGDIGEKFVQMMDKVSPEIQSGIGARHKAMVELGIITPTKDVAKGLKLVERGITDLTGNRELSQTAHEFIEQTGVFANETTRRKWMVKYGETQLGKAISYVQTAYPAYFGKIKNAGVTVKELAGGYKGPHVTSLETLGKWWNKNGVAIELAGATTREAKEGIYYKNSSPVVVDAVEDAVLLRKEWPTMEEGFRNYYAWVDFVKSGGRRPMTNANLMSKMARDAGISVKDMEKRVLEANKYSKSTLTPRATSLDFERKINLPFYDPNPFRVFPQFMMEAETRLAYANNFGANDKILKDMLTAVAQDGKWGDKSKAMMEKFETLIRASTGQTQAGHMDGTFKALRAIQAVKLPFAVILNMGQSLNDVLVADTKSFWKGLSTGFTRESLEKRLAEGVLYESLVKQSLEHYAEAGTFGSNILKWSGFNRVEIFNRVVGATTAEHFFKGNFAALQKLAGTPGFMNSQPAKLLKEFGIDVEAALAEGKLTNQLVAPGVQKFVELTQFGTSNMNLPIFSSTGWGKTIFQFKSFSYGQAKLAWHELVGQAQKGNWGKFMRNAFVIGVVFPFEGEVLGDLRSLITQDKRPTKAWDRYWNSLAMAGGFGMWGDFLNSAESGGVLDWMLGPSAQDAQKYFAAFTQIGTAPFAGEKAGKEFKAGGKKLIQQVARQGGVTRPLLNVIPGLQPTTPGESTLETAGRLLGGQKSTSY